MLQNETILKTYKIPRLHTTAEVQQSAGTKRRIEQAIMGNGDHSRR